MARRLSGSTAANEQHQGIDHVYSPSDGTGLGRRLMLFEPHGPVRDVLVECVAEIGFRPEAPTTLPETLSRAEGDGLAIVLVDLCASCLDDQSVVGLTDRLAALPQLVVIVDSVAALRQWEASLTGAIILTAPFDLEDLLTTLSAFHGPGATRRAGTADRQHAEYQHA